LTLLTKDLERPNGIALSPDEKTLYLANSHAERQVIMAYQLKKDGTLGRSRVLFNAAESAKSREGACDGMTVDTEGNLWATVPGGVAIFTPEGKQLGLLATGDRTANCEFGEDGSTLFIAANHRVLKIRTAAKGLGF
jgi:gluconolactonase